MAKAPKPAPRKRVLKAPVGGLTVKSVIAAMRATAGIQAYAAAKLKVNRSTVCRFIQAHPEIQDALDEIKEENLDISEGKLYAAIRAGEFPAVKFHLEQHGGDRGYGKKVALTGKNGGPIEIATSGGVSGMLAAARAAKNADPGST